MEHKVNIYIQHQDDQSVADPLVDFFRVVARTAVLKEEEPHYKEWDEAIKIVLGVIGAWASERYILDPLADKLEEWMGAIRATWTRSGSKRPLHIVITFNDSTDKLSIEFLKTADLRVLENVWNYIRSVLQVRADAQSLGIRLQKVRVLWEDSEDFLVIGYEDGRPAYLIDVHTAQLRSLQRGPSPSNQIDTAGELWLLEKMIERNNYLRAISERGYAVKPTEIQQMQNEIAQRKKKLRG